MATPVLGVQVGFRVGLMTMPEEMVAMPIAFDFANDASQILTKEFEQEFTELKIPYIQSVYIDNSLDADALTLAVNGGTQQSITVKGHTQGYYPLALAQGNSSITVSSTGSTETKQLIFFSMIVPPCSWATA